MAKSRFGRGKGGRKGKGKGRGKGKGHRGKGTKKPPPEIEVPESSQSSAAPSNVHADVNQPSASPWSSMENTVGRSDGVGSVAMPPVEGVESDALDEASGLQSSSSRAPNADAGFADGVQTDLPMVPVPPPESPCLDEVPCPEVVPAGSCDEIQLHPDYPLPLLVSLLVVMQRSHGLMTQLFQVILLSLLVVMQWNHRLIIQLFQLLGLLEGQMSIPPRRLCIHSWHLDHPFI